MMSRVRSKDSQAELALRRELHAAGMRYRLHARDVPGIPDIVVRRRQLAIFVDGDLWHRNPAEPGRRGRSSFAELFPTRTEFWLAKLERNVRRDEEVNARLMRDGWTVIRLWESEVLRDAAAAAGEILSAYKGRER